MYFFLIFIDMRKIIQTLLRESLMGEVSDSIHTTIKQSHMNDRIAVTKNEEINFIPVPSSSQPKIHKPKGLWYGIGDSWISFIKRNDMPTWDYDYVHKIEIDESKMVIIRNMDDLIKFDADFGYDNESRIFYDAGRMIDWERVAAMYGGIEIAPYLNDGYEYKWYEIWDVASGCIWGDGIITGSGLIR